MVLIAVVAVVVVVVLALSVLLLAGVVNKSGNGSSGPQTFSQASSSVSSATNNYKGGGWKQIVAIGLAPRASISSGTSSLPTGFLSAGGCSASLLISNGTSFTVAGYNGSLASGQGTGWIFILANSSGALVAIDLEGSVTLVAYIAGSASCPIAGSFGFLSGLNSGIVDSSTAASAAWKAGASAFVAAHPNASVSYAITSGVSAFGVTEPAKWEIAWQACTPSATPSATPVPTFNATINAATGQLISSSTTSQVCSSGGNFTGSSGGGTPLGSVLSFGAVAEAQAGAKFYYNFTINSAGGGLTWSAVTLLIQGTNGAVATGVTSYAVYSLMGTVICYSNGSVESGWNPGPAGSGATAISAAQTVVVVSSANLAGLGDRLVAAAAGYTGTSTASVP